MKNLKIFLLLLCSLFFTAYFTASAQKSTGINNTNPSPKAALHIKRDGSALQGIIIPKLGDDTTALKTAGLTIAEKGLIFYDTINSLYQYWSGSRWMQFGGAGSSGTNGWGLTGNSLVLPDTNANYLGTNNNYPLIFKTNGTERMRISRLGNVAIGKAPKGGIPLQVKSNSKGVAFQIEQQSVEQPLFEFRQNLNNNARFQMYDIAGNPTIELNAESGSDNWIKSGNVGIGTSTPDELLHLFKGSLLIEGEVPSPTATSGGGMLRYKSSGGHTHTWVNESSSNDLVLWSSMDAGSSWFENMRFHIGGEIEAGKRGSGSFGFMIDKYGNLSQINSIGYSWPVTQGAANTVLTNNGSGVLTWASAGGAGASLWSENISKNKIYVTNSAYKVGIGSNNDPNAKVEIVDAVGSKILGLVGGNGAMMLSTESMYNQIASRSWDYSAGRGLYLTASTVANQGIYVDPTGNIGVGTNTPSEKLTVMNDLYGLSHINTANTVKMSSYIGNSYTTTSIPGASVGTQTDHPFFIYVNNNGEKFYIGNSTQNYNVGIGTANPLTKVQITTTEIEPANSGINATGHLRLEGTGTPIVTDIGVVDDTYNGGWLQVHNRNNQSLNYPLLLNPNGGNVGIGTATPNAPLQFSNAIANRKIVLYDGFNNDHQYYGFGINGSILRYQTDATSSDHVFYSAYSATSSTELMRIMGTGNIGIGTSTPAHRLTLTGGLVNAIYVGSSNILTSSQTSSQLILQSGTGLFVYPTMNPEWTISVSDNDPAAGQPTDGYLVFSRRTSSIATPSKLMVLDNNSLNPFADGGMTLGASTYKWGTVYSTVGTLNTSDRRAKKDIQPIKHGLNEVLKLQPVSYKWKNDSLNTTKLGLIAQDLEKILPEVVVTPKMPNEQYGVYYSDMIPVLVKAIQEQQKMIESLQSEIKLLKK